MNLLVTIGIFIFLTVLGQLSCFYLFWIYGEPWALIPRGGLTFGCTVALAATTIASSFIIALYFETKEKS